MMVICTSLFHIRFLSYTYILKEKYHFFKKQFNVKFITQTKDSCVFFDGHINEKL
jgi:hypothetical protein